MPFQLKLIIYLFELMRLIITELGQRQTGNEINLSLFKCFVELLFKFFAMVNSHLLRQLGEREISKQSQPIMT